MWLTFMKCYQQYKNATIPHFAEPVLGARYICKVHSRMPHALLINDLVIDDECPSVDINMQEKVKTN